MWIFQRLEFSWRAGFPIGFYLNPDRDKIWITFGIPFIPIYYKWYPPDSFEVQWRNHWT